MPEITGKSDGDRTCRYGTRYLLKQISTLRKEIPGVLEAADIEHIHRMRVAMRRLRSALPLFPLCYPGKKIRRWRRDLRETARVLGEARDTDVQIDFLRGYVSNLKAGRPAGSLPWLPAVIPPAALPVLFEKDRFGLSTVFRKLRSSIRSALVRAGGYLGGLFGEKSAAPPAGQAERPDPVPGTESLLLRKTQERAGLQKEIRKAIRRMERAGLLGEMEKALRREEDRGDGITEAPRELYATAFTSVTTRIDDLLAFGDALADRGRTAEHHAMRIAVKRLRYTLEVWRGLYDDELEDEIGTLKHLQELLGDLHDCDVWIAYIPGFLREEEMRCRAFFGNDHHFRGLVPGIQAFARERAGQRERLHGMTLTLWRDLESRGYWDGLRERTLTPLTGNRGTPVRIGVVANVTGDAVALRRVLADGHTEGADLFLNAGDILGPPRGTRETVTLLREEGIVSVAGNRDRQIPDGLPPDATAADPMQGQLKLTRRFLRGLPPSLRISLDGKHLFLTHGSPDSPIGCVDGATPEETLCRIGRETGAAVVITGHPRAPLIREACGVLFVNPGAAGTGEGGDAVPSYAILEFAAGAPVRASCHGIRNDPAGSHPDAPLRGDGVSGVPEKGEPCPVPGDE